jgi:tetraacyldisaccharide 4'-kinase
MLRAQVPGATVCVSPDRYLGGVLAEKLGCTVHILDDGFQHIELARDLDMLVTTIGRFRMARDSARTVARADGCGGARAFPGRVGCDAGAAAPRRGTLGISQSCGRADARAPVGITGSGQDPGPSKVLAVAGIANPDRFVTSLRDADGTSSMR